MRADPWLTEIAAGLSSFTSLPDTVSATCPIVVSFDWSSTRYFLPDHLNSTNVVTDASESPIEVLDYYPYGSTRINQTTNNFNEGKQFIAQYSDPETNLSYLQQRYMNGTNGQFLSEDPVFLGDPSQQDLANPQSLNSYSYGNDNPTNKSDPSGRGAGPLGALSAVALAGIVAALYTVLTILSNPQTYHSSGQAVSSLLNQSAQLVQTLSSTHPLINMGGTANTTPGITITPLNPSQSSQINLSDPKAPKTFIPPTNPPQLPPSPDQLPPGDKIRIGPKTQQYPDGYWQQTNAQGQPVDPSTGKPPSDAQTTPDVRSRTHVPLPPGTNLPPGPYTP